MINLKKIELGNQKIILVILAGLFVAYLDFSFIIQAQLKSKNSRQAQIRQLKKNMDILTNDLKIMQQANQNQAQASGVKKFIREEQVSALLKDISAIANRNIVRIMQIMPSKDPQAKALKPDEPALGVSPVLITLSLQCDYHHLGKFINDLENFEKFISVVELKIIPGADSSFQQEANLVLKTYVKK